MKSRKTVEFSEGLNKRWLGYAAAAAAGVGMLATAQPATADVIYTPANINIPYFSWFFLDVNNDGVVDFGFHGTTTLGAGPRGSYRTLGLEAYASGRNGFAKKGLPLGRGAVIGPAGSFTNLVGLANLQQINTIPSGGRRSYPSGPWADVIGYLGFEFQISGQAHYGWAELEVLQVGVGTPLAWMNGTITGYAYDTVAGQSIDAGQTTATPEPSTLGLLAIGSLGLGYWRRKAVGSKQ